jgi:WD40 repeat protein
MEIKGSTIDISFTPNSQFLISGSEDGKIHIWDVEN